MSVRIGEGNDIGGFVVSTDNSTTTPLLASGTFTGTSEDVSAYNQIHITLYFEPNEVPNGDLVTAQGSFWFEFSTDNVNFDTQVPAFVRSGIFIPYTLVVIAPYFRVRS